MNWLGWSANITGCLAFLFMSRKWWWAPIFGVAQQCLWAAWCIRDGLWPLLVTTVFFVLTYGAAIPKWTRERISR